MADAVDVRAAAAACTRSATARDARDVVEDRGAGLFASRCSARIAVRKSPSTKDPCRR
jgi:hypothetical protein